MGMSKSGIGYTNDKVTWYWKWEPCGYGCSAHCMAPRKCWAEQQAPRQRRHCPDCADFKVHFHEDRLGRPAKTKKPGFTLTGFHADMFDLMRSRAQISQICSAMAEAPHHQYIMLTQQAQRAWAEFASPALLQGWPQNWYLGCTIRSQAEAKERLGPFLQIPGKLWVSYEPAWEAVDFHDAFYVGYSEEDKRRVKYGGVIHGVIVGHDNRRGAPGTDTLDHIRSVVQQCKAAGVNVFVKQIWDVRPEEVGRAKRGFQFLRASHPAEYALYPADLKLRDLPWDAAIKEGMDARETTTH